jgi:hypothetical protein
MTSENKTTQSSALTTGDFRAPASPAIRLLWIGAILVTVAIFAWMTWASWGSLRIDCGREMYVPQQISQGKMLYRDLWYPYGPLAPYWNALLFKIFGDSLNVLYASGLAITLALAFVLFAVSRMFVSSFAAFVVVFVFLLEAFRTHLFNYILPYSYGSTLGSLLAFLFLYYLLRHIQRKPGPNLFLAGLLAGLALLTKAEFGAACYLTFAFIQIFRSISNRSVRRMFSGFSAFFPGVLIPALGYGYFLARLSLLFFVNDSFSREWYVAWSRRQGLRFVPSEVLNLVMWALVALLIWAAIAFLLARAFNARRRVLVLGTLLFVVLLGALYQHWSAYMPLTFYYLLHSVLFPSGMFWLVVGYLTWLLVRLPRKDCQPASWSLIALCFFALALGMRVMSKAEPANYSIYYSTALFLVFVIVLTQIAEKVSARFSSDRRSFVVIGLVAFEALGMLASIYPWRVRPVAQLQTDRGSIYARRSEAGAFPAIIRFMREQKAAGKTVLVLPEETSLYFLAGTEAPSRWYMIHPGILGSEDRERRYLSQLETRRIDFVLLSNRTNKEYGYSFFGIDYDRLIYDWIESHFEVVGEFGQFSRENTTEFGMLIYRRRPISSP